MARDLEQAKVDVLMWSQDGSLRYVPLAALYDGRYYLIEKYSLEIFTPACTSHLKDRSGLSCTAAEVRGYPFHSMSSRNWPVFLENSKRFPQLCRPKSCSMISFEKTQCCALLVSILQSTSRVTPASGREMRQTHSSYWATDRT